MASVMVTGASRGIGLATCVSLARAGHQWTDWWSVDDDAWYAAVERDFGLNARQ